MRVWTTQDARARFSELLRASESEGPQIVTRRGVEAAILVPIEEWRRLTAHEHPRFEGPTLKGTTLKDWLLRPEPRSEDLAPRR